MKINLGCRNNLLKDYINVDIQEMMIKTDCPFLCANALDIDRHFKANSVDEVVSEHFFEHLTHAEITNLLYKIFVILKPGGTIKITVPDFKGILEVYEKKHQNGDFTDVDILHIKVFDVPEEGLHKTVWYDYIGEFYLIREGLFTMYGIEKPSPFEICFTAIVNK